MNFSTIRYFLTVEKERNFTRAAERLNITQQTLGAQIANIENELGCKFFIRHTPLELTDEGRLFREYAQILNRTYESMIKEFRDIANDTSGILRVGISIMRGRTLMPSIISAFGESYPGYEVVLTEATNESLKQYLLDGEIDLAVGGFPEKIPGIRLFPFYREEVVLVISKALLDALGAGAGDDMDFSKIAEWPFVLGSRDDMAGRIGRQFLIRHNIKPRIRAQSASMETILRMCAKGIGAAFCQKNLLDDFLSAEHGTDLVSLPLDEDASYMIRFGIPDTSRKWRALYDFMKICSLHSKTDVNEIAGQC